MDPVLLEKIDLAAQWVRDAGRVVALTGAGISVDSGIPDFRSPGGLWERFNPMEYATVTAFRKDPEKVWRMVASLNGLLESARPNAGHFALARMEAAGRLRAIVTQNIDNLHQDAGSGNVIEFHGNGRHLICLRCGKRYPATHDFGGAMPPRCDCEPDGPILKPDVVFFGEMIPPRALATAERETREADVMIVAGTSAFVAPASLLPAMAKEHGARVIEVNREATPLTGYVAELSLRGGTSDILPALADRVCG